MDALSEIFDTLQLRGTLYFRTAFSPPWSVEIPALGRTARFHLIVQGRCHVGLRDHPDVALDPGDLAVIPNGAGHVLSDSPGRAPARIDDVLKRSGYSGKGVLAFGGEPDADAATSMICGHLSFADGMDHPLLRALPACLVVTAKRRADAPWLDELMQLITRQVFAGAPGVNASVVRLTEALFIEVVRTCTDQDPALRGIIEAAGDIRIGRALSLMHRGLAREWTLDSIAREVGMSRSGFASRFQSLMKISPMGYLSGLRLHKAMNMLATTGEPIQRIAAKVGYQSPAAFSRAFAGHFGQSPRDIRRLPI